MKKLSALIVTAILLVSSAAIPATAAYGKSNHRNCTSICSAFIDKDKDGVCDNKEAANKKKPSSKKNTNAKREAAANKRAAVKKNTTNKHCVSSFVDANNDGVCDNKNKTCNKTGSNFVDADKNGICDNRASRPGGNCRYR